MFLLGLFFLAICFLITFGSVLKFCLGLNEAPTYRAKCRYMINFISLAIMGFLVGNYYGFNGAEVEFERQKAEPANKKQALQDSVAILELEQKLQTLKQSK